MLGADALLVSLVQGQSSLWWPGPCVIQDLKDVGPGTNGDISYKVVSDFQSPVSIFPCL